MNGVHGSLHLLWRVAGAQGGFHTLGEAKREGGPRKTDWTFLTFRARRAGHGARVRARPRDRDAPVISRRPAVRSAERPQRENVQSGKKNTVLLCNVIQAVPTLCKIRFAGSTAVDYRMPSFFAPPFTFDLAEDEDGYDMFSLVGQGALLIGTAGVVSAGVVLSLLHCSRGVLVTAFGLSAGIWAVAAFVSALYLPLLFFIIPAIMFIVIVRAIKTRWHRIEFGAANLQARGFYNGLQRHLRFEMENIAETPYFCELRVVLGIERATGCV